MMRQNLINNLLIFKNKQGNDETKSNKNGYPYSKEGNWVERKDMKAILF